MENQALKQARRQKGWSQQDVAKQIGTNRFTVTRWERGMATPSPYYRQQLCTLFAMSPGELGLLNEETSANSLALPPYWNVPFRRNPFFTGRETLLRTIFTLLTEGEERIVALSGLAGVGKTQLAIEYAYRHRRRYQAVLWVQADSSPLLIAEFGYLAHVLQLTRQGTQDEQQAIQAVRCWLQEHRPWLLVFDNVEECDGIRRLLPAVGQGHVLFTTRLQASNTLAHHIEVEALTPEEGACFLLRRAKIIPSSLPTTSLALPAFQAAATLSQVMDHLPLALDQAGAYIEETGCDIAGYLTRYQQHQFALLQRRGNSPDHPTSLATTWSISFDTLQHLNPLAALLLQWCALLHPDAIPEELFTAIPQAVSFPPLAADVLQLDSLINVLRTFSLIRRHPDTQTVSLHRLVQAVLRATMDEPMLRRVAQQVVHAVNAVFPECQPSTWPLCHRYLSQALACAQVIEHWHFTFPEAARLLAQTGAYLQAHASYDQATTLYLQAIEIHRQLASLEQAEGAQCLFALATLYEVQWRTEEAEALYREVIAIRTRLGEAAHSALAQSLTALALFYYKQDKYAQAESLYQQAMDVLQHTAGPTHPGMADCLSNLGTLYREQGKYSQAEALQKQALYIREQAFGNEHIEVASSLRQLAILSHEQGHYSQAEGLYKRALAIREAKLGPHHPEVALILRGLGLLCYGQRKYPEAEDYYKRVLYIRQHTLRSEHPLVADVFTLLAELAVVLQRWDEAKEYFLRALRIWESLLEPDNPDLAHCFNGLAEVAIAQKAYSQAEALCQQAMDIMKRTFGESHQYIAQSLHILATLRYAQGRYDEADMYYQQALAMVEYHLSEVHPRIALSLQGLACSYQKQGMYQQALPLYQRLLTIYAQFLAPDHPDVVHAQQQYTHLLRQAPPNH